MAAPNLIVRTHKSPCQAGAVHTGADASCDKCSGETSTCVSSAYEVLRHPNPASHRGRHADRSGLREPPDYSPCSSLLKVAALRRSLSNPKIPTIGEGGAQGTCRKCLTLHEALEGRVS